MDDSIITVKNKDKTTKKEADAYGGNHSESIGKSNDRRKIYKIVTDEKEYKKKNKTIRELSEQIKKYDLTKEIRLAIDKLISANNDCTTSYPELAYIQGMKDAVAMLKEMDLLKTTEAKEKSEKMIE